MSDLNVRATMMAEELADFMKKHGITDMLMVFQKEGMANNVRLFLPDFKSNHVNYIHEVAKNFLALKNGGEPDVVTTTIYNKGDKKKPG